MKDSFNRVINYVRISVTDRCNFRCSYCMPKEGIKPLKEQEILSLSEIIDITKKLTQWGISKVRLTGGEPLVRKNLVDLVAHLAQIENIDELCITTNGSLLKKYAASLYEAGLDRINVSLDTIDPVKFKEITRMGSLEDVIEGIFEAKRVGFKNIKLNCVVDHDKEESDALQIAEFSRKHNLTTRFIRKMDIKSGQFWEVDGGSGGKCATCNRIRITCNGDILPCLFNDTAFNIRKYGLEKAFRLAIEHKPFKGMQSKINRFNRIGG